MSDEDIIVTDRPPRATYRGGPGAHERLTLTTWTNEHHVGWVRTSGTFTTYCGHGWEHEVNIDIAEPRLDVDGDTVGDTMANQVEEALADWDDPCDTDDTWKSCSCADCADERSLQRGIAADPERYATL